MLLAVHTSLPGGTPKLRCCKQLVYSKLQIRLALEGSLLLLLTIVQLAVNGNPFQLLDLNKCEKPVPSSC